MVSWTTTLGLAVVSAAAVNAAQSCSASQQCPDSAPCCSQYGQCGTGMACLGGCDPQGSFSLNSCLPMPVCQSGTTNFDDISGIAKIQDWLGDTSNTSWVYTGGLAQDTADKAVLLTMPANSVGTVLSTAHYIWYGNVKVTMKTSQDDGVVSDFIMMSNVKDEIDYEFVGSDLNNAQSNYYWQGLLNYNNQVKGSAANTNTDFHTYEVDWTEDQVTWLIDGNAFRTLKKSDTWNETLNAFMYPQTPCRLQLGIWPGGAKDQGEGTIQWAGGPINWDSPTIQKDGYYAVTVQSVDITCYDPPAGTSTNGSTSYVYTNSAGLVGDVAITGEDTILNDANGSGIDNVSQTIADASQVSTSAASIPGASEVSSKGKKTKSSSTSIPDASAVASSTKSSDSKATDSASSGSSASGSSAADSTGSSSASGSAAASTSAAKSNGAAVLAVPSILTALGFAALLF